jgi:anti-sigma factor RsiW
MRVFSEFGHVREEPLALYALGDLPGPATAEVEWHMRDCRRCRVSSVEIAEFIQMLRLLAARIPRSEPGLARRLPPPRAAAVSR